MIYEDKNYDKRKIYILYLFYPRIDIIEYSYHRIKRLYSFYDMIWNLDQFYSLWDDHEVFYCPTKQDYLYKKKRNSHLLIDHDISSDRS